MQRRDLPAECADYHGRLRAFVISAARLVAGGEVIVGRVKAAGMRRGKGPIPKEERAEEPGGIGDPHLAVVVGVRRLRATLETVPQKKEPQDLDGIAQVQGAVHHDIPAAECPLLTVVGDPIRVPVHTEGGRVTFRKTVTERGGGTCARR